MIEALGTLQYEDLEEKEKPDRHALKSKDPNPDPPQNIYVCVENSQALKNHLLVPEVYRVSEDLDRYSAAKLELFKQDWRSVDEYEDPKIGTLM